MENYQQMNSSLINWLSLKSFPFQVDVVDIPVLPILAVPGFAGLMVGVGRAGIYLFRRIRS
jgi:hypothetical protein